MHNVQARFDFRHTDAWKYFALALGWSYLFWIGMIVFGVAFGSSLGTVLYALGGIGPLVAGIGLTYRTQGPAGRRDYWRRVFDLRPSRAVGGR